MIAIAKLIERHGASEIARRALEKRGPPLVAFQIRFTLRSTF